MSSKSKNKGSSWERSVAADLSSWYGESFIRTPSSGGYVGGTNSSRKETLHEDTVRVMKGDIVVPPEFSNLVIECKSYKDFKWHQFFFDAPIPKLEGWLKQLDDSADDGDIQLLIMKFDYVGKFVAAPEKHGFQFTHGAKYSSETYGNWIVTNYSDFFKLNRELLKIISKKV